MKIAYLHGLESDCVGPKNIFLSTLGDVYDPCIDYKEQGIYRKIRDEVKEFQPDIIMGSSMGGYFAYEMARELGIPALLFNPGLHNRTMEPDTKGRNRGTKKPFMKFIFGKHDDVIPFKPTMYFVRRNDADYQVNDYGHRTPYKDFVREVKKFIEEIKL